MELIKWETLLSTCRNLYFERLIDDDCLEIIIVDQDEKVYSVTFTKFGPYQIVDESWLNHYWKIKDINIGPTFIVENSDWAEKFNPLKDVYPKIKHFVIATGTSCLEILTENEPIIKKI